MNSRVFSGKEEMEVAPSGNLHESILGDWSGMGGMEPQQVLFFSLSHLPRIYQAFLMSATFNDDVQALKELVLHNPVS